VKANDLGSVELANCQVDGMFTIQHAPEIERVKNKSQIGFNMSAATLGGGVNLSNCNIKTYSRGFDKAIFAPMTEINLDGAIIDGNLTIVASPEPPKSVKLDGCVITGETKICSQLGQPMIEITAKGIRPIFHKEVMFKSVSLRECKLVGNPIDKIALSNIRWCKAKNGRSMLYDETLLSPNSPITTNIKEAYQILKEKYRQFGDHSTSGDFHFGEMEMKRHEYGDILRKNLSLIAFYHALSGYGTEPARATRLLGLLFLLAMSLFALALQGDCTENIFTSLELTLQAASFQPLSSNQADHMTVALRLVFLGARIILPL
jgi:hypothetical protein